MPNWTDVGSKDDFPAGAKTCLDAGGTPLVVCNLDGQMHTFANICPHAGMPLGSGELNGKIVTCPFHGYAFNVEPGKNADFPADVPLAKFPVRTTKGGRVEVDVDGQRQEGM